MKYKKFKNIDINSIFYINGDSYIKISETLSKTETGYKFYIDPDQRVQLQKPKPRGGKLAKAECDRKVVVTFRLSPWVRDELNKMSDSQGAAIELALIEFYKLKK